MKSEVFEKSFYTLFEFKLWHSYFLGIVLADDSLDYANSYPNDPLAQALLKRYDVRQFLRIVPDTATQVLMSQHRLQFQLTSTGFRIVGPASDVLTGMPPTLNTLADVKVELGTSFNFLFYTVDPLFTIYTSLVDHGSLKQQQPSDTYPKGRCYVLSSSSFFYLPSAKKHLYFSAFSSISVLPWQGPEPLPFQRLTITHQNSPSYYLPNSSQLTKQPLLYEAYYDTRASYWLYKGHNPQYQSLGGQSYPLLYHNPNTLNGTLPPATPANTFYVKDDPNNSDPNAPRHFESYIY